MKLGFLFTRNAICALNLVFMMVGCFLIGESVRSTGLALAVSVNIVSAVLALAVFLILISAAGIIGTIRQHQVLLFFYVAVLLLVFFLQFGVSCSCLAFSKHQQMDILTGSWRTLSPESRRTLEQRLDCCGLINRTENPQEFRLEADICIAACKFRGLCFKCGDIILQDADETLKVLGSVGLLFSFTELLAVWLVLRYRNQKNPQTGPSSF